MHPRHLHCSFTVMKSLALGVVFPVHRAFRLDSRWSVWTFLHTVLEHRQQSRAGGEQRARLRPLPRVDPSNSSF
jgi:hypothetical protein